MSNRGAPSPYGSVFTSQPQPQSQPSQNMRSPTVYGSVIQAPQQNNYRPPQPPLVDQATGRPYMPPYAQSQYNQMYRQPMQMPQPPTQPIMPPAQYQYMQPQAQNQGPTQQQYMPQQPSPPDQMSAPNPDPSQSGQLGYPVMASAMMPTTTPTKNAMAATPPPGQPTLRAAPLAPITSRLVLRQKQVREDDTVLWDVSSTPGWISVVDETSVVFQLDGVYSVYVAAHNLSISGSKIVLLGGSVPVALTNAIQDTSATLQAVRDFSAGDALNLRVHTDISNLGNVVVEMVVVKLL